MTDMPSERAVAAVLDAAAAWVWVPPDAVDRQSAEYRLVLYPDRASVVASSTSRPVSDLVEDVEIMVRRLDPSREALRWWVSGRTTPSSTLGDLLTLGFVVEEEVEVLAGDLTDPALLQRIGSAPQVRVTTVDDEAGLVLAGELAAEAFGEDPPTAEQRATSLADLRADHASGRWRYRQVVAWLDDEPVGTAGGSLVNGVLRLWGGAVVEQARGRGAYRALVAARCAFGAGVGARTVLVKGRTTTSAPILRRVGLERFDVETCVQRVMSAPVDSEL